MTLHLPTEDTPLAEAALLYAAQGWPVVILHKTTLTPEGPRCSCKKGLECGSSTGKHPRLPRWPEQATCDPDEIRALWKRYPDSNIGIAMGQGEARLLAVDVDGQEGRDSLAQLPSTPPTLTSRSGREDGGQHLVFRVPPGIDLSDISNRQGTKLGAGIDVRGQGGQIVVAPSLHPSGQRYRWTTTLEPQDAPAWMLLKLQAPPPAPAYTPPPLPPSTPGRMDHPWAIDTMEGRYEEVSSTSHRRHTALFSAASCAGEYIAAGHLDEGDVRRRLRDAGLASGLQEDREFWHQIDNGLREGKKTPRHLPELTGGGGSARPPRPPSSPPPPSEPGAPPGDDPPDDDDPDAGEVLWIDRPDGTRRGLEFGPRVAALQATAEGVQTTVLGQQLWPLGHTIDVETGSYGVCYRYRDRAGKERRGVLEARSWTDKSPARAAACEMADAGVQVAPWKGVNLVMHLGEWGQKQERGQVIKTVARPGWHEGGVYVGATCHGADWLVVGSGARETRGELYEWRAEASTLATTPGLKLALGASFAGALVGRLDCGGFLVHLAGGSSTGKSRAAYLASSVWYGRRRALTWNGTANGLEMALSEYDGACVVLDELKEGKPHHVAELIHRISDGRGRLRSNRQGTDTLRRKEWALCGISTGEVTVADYLGRMSQGGHTVRALDVRIRPGDCTTDAAHADKIDTMTARYHGTAGEAWGAYLAALSEEGWERLRARITSLQEAHRALAVCAEEVRTLKLLAVCVAALEEAYRADLFYGTIDPGLLMQWAFAQVAESRGEATGPEARALLILREIMDTEPSRFPTPSIYRDQKGQTVVGVAEAADASAKAQAGLPAEDLAYTGWIWTTEAMLKRSGCTQAGCGPRQLIEWMASRGLVAEGSGRRAYVAGHQARWHKIRIADPSG